MEEPRRRPLPIRFGVFELNLHAGELHKQGVKIKLQEQPFLVLAMLVEHPGDVVTREELQKQLWPSDTFVDFERGLNRAINKLREALADDADSPRFIETLPRRGYRFVAPVDSGEPVKHPLALVKPEVPPEAPEDFAKVADKTSKGLWFAALLVLSGISAIFFLYQRPAAKTQLLRLQLSPPAEGSFVEGGSVSTGGMALSPDGQTLAFVALVDGVNGLWVRPLSGAARKLPADGLPLNPFWSPDGRSIGFFQGTSLRSIDTAGGAPVIICSLPFAGGWSGAWSEDGRILIGSVFDGIRIVSASGGTPTPFTTLDTAAGERSHMYPQVLPGGSFLYWTFNYKPENETIFAAALAKPSQRQRLISAQSSAVYSMGYLLWRSGTALLAQPLDASAIRLSGQPYKLLEPVSQGIVNELTLTVSSTGQMVYDASRAGIQNTWYERSGHVTGTLGEAGAWGAMRISPDNRRSVISGGAASVNWGFRIVDERGQSSALMANVVTLNPTWSPDGKYIAFGQPGVGLGRTATTAEGTNLSITKSGNEQVPTDWSGGVILFTETSPNTGRDIWSIRVASDGSVAPGAKAEPFLQTQHEDVAARFAPAHNQRWIAYQSNESGRPEVYIQSYPIKAEKVAVSRGGGRYPVWGPRGTELFFLTLDNRLMAVKVNLNEASAQCGLPQELFPLPKMETESLYSSPYETHDGQNFLVHVPLTQANRPFDVIDNWPALLTH